MLTLVLLVATALTCTDVNAQAVRRCQSTGPLCYNEESCPTLVSQTYQWCGACDYNLRCLGGVADFFNSVNPLYPQWDDHKKGFEATSTTCTECYVECPPWAPTAPKEDGNCTTTGPGCVNDVNFCYTIFTARRLQYCKSCTAFVDCTGSPFTSSIANCPGGQVWDDKEKNCVAAGTSKTCKECYQYCTEDDWITEAPPVITTQEEDDEPTTKVNLGGDGGDGNDVTEGGDVIDVTGGNGDGGAAGLNAAGKLVGLLLLFCGLYARLR